MSYLSIIAGLLVIVLIHELGHFLAARSVGIRATRFMVGFPPRLWSFHRGETEYGLGAILLGGYVRLSGMFQPTPSDVVDRLGPVSRSIAESAGSDHPDVIESELKRIASSSSPDDLPLALRRLDYALMAAADGLDDPSVGRDAARARGRIADIIDDLHPHAYWRASLPRRMWVIAAGPLANIVTAMALLFVLAAWFSPIYSMDWTIHEVAEDSPAQQAGIRTGDVIRSWNGVDADADGFREAVSDSSGRTVAVEIEREDSQRLTFELRPTDIEGEKRVGIRFQPENITRVGTRDRSMAEAASATWELSSRLVGGMVTGIARLVYEPQAREDVGTVVGVVQVAPDIQEQGRGWEYLAFLSFVIAIFNLIPLLPLDGGHLTFGIIEAVRRRPLPRLAFEQASFVGLALIGILFVMGLQNDLNR